MITWKSHEKNVFHWYSSTQILIYVGDQASNSLGTVLMLLWSHRWPAQFFVSSCCDHPIRNITSSKTKPTPKWHREGWASEIATCAAAAEAAPRLLNNWCNHGCCTFIIPTDQVSVAFCVASPWCVRHCTARIHWKLPQLKPRHSNWKLIFVHSVTVSCCSSYTSAVAKLYVQMVKTCMLTEVINSFACMYVSEC